MTIDQPPKTHIFIDRLGNTHAFQFIHVRIASRGGRTYTNVTRASLRHKDGTHSRFEWNETKDHYLLFSAFLQPALRNLGIGSRVHQFLVDEALGKGKTFLTDFQISSSFLRLYPKLSQAGYCVSYAPDDAVKLKKVSADLIEAGIRAANSIEVIEKNGRPVVAVTKNGTSSPEPDYIKQLAHGQRPASRLRQKTILAKQPS